MKVVGVLAAGLVLALAPAGAAFAGNGPNGTAYGNCGVSSAGGKTVHTGLAGKGNGGMVTVAKAGRCAAAVDAEVDAPDDEVADEVEHVSGPPAGVGGGTTEG